MNRLLQEYADDLVLGDKDRRLLDDYQTLSREWIAGAKQAMSLADEGRDEEAVALVNGTVAELGVRLSKVSNEWIAYDQEAATAAGQESIAGIERFQRQMFVANSTAFLLTGLLGFLTFRRIVTPIQALEASVKTIAAGDYAKAVPFVGATDETGGLARSIDVLKQGAAAMDEQRWVKSNVSRLTGELQGAASLAEFGQRLLSGLVPMLGGGIAGFYVFDETLGHLQRVSAYGLADTSDAASSIRLGEGLVGQCAQRAKGHRAHESPAGLLPHRLRSRPGCAAPGDGAAGAVQGRPARRARSGVLPPVQHAGEVPARRIAAGGGHEPGNPAAQPSHRRSCSARRRSRRASSRNRRRNWSAPSRRPRKPPR